MTLACLAAFPAVPLACAAALMAATAAVAQQPSSSTPQAADKTLGAAIMSAFVGSNGVAAHMSGVTATERVDTGRYRITFARDISYVDCAFSVTPLAGTANTVNIVGGRTLYVYIFNILDGSYYSADFSIIAFCHR